MHVPGLEVYAPSTPQEVFSTLINASRKNSPTIILEHRWLFDIQGNVAVDEDLPLPKSSIVVSSDPAASVTLVTISFSTLEVTRARDLLSDQNIKIDIIEVSRLDKLDLESIIKSTLKTKKLILVDIGHSFAGASSAILSELYCAGMTLDSPPIILGLPRYPTPTAPSLARDYYPRCIDILNSITSLIGSSVKFIDPDYGKQLDVPGDRFIGYY
jgi:pyruvate dehydrogenase E1 component beta subunit